MSTTMPHRRRILFLGMYPLDRIDKAPKVRIRNLSRALAKLAEVELISGDRAERRGAIRKYLRRAGHLGAYGLYVETCTSWCTVEDLRLMHACRRAGIPVLAWIRDAYPLFPETRRGLAVHKRIGSSILWRASMWGYSRTSDAIGSQSEGFSRLFRYPPHVRRVVLPPAAREIDASPVSGSADALLYTGNASEERFGVGLLVEAAEVARQEVRNLRLLLVCPPHGLPPQELHAGRPWVELLSLTTDKIPGLLPQVRALVNPLLDEPYHRLQIPMKVMDYLGYGRPILATDLPEIRQVILDSQGGIVVPATRQGLAEGIVQLFTAPLDEANRMGQNALRAVREKHSWRHRAQQILDLFAAIRETRPG